MAADALHYVGYRLGNMMFQIPVVLVMNTGTESFFTEPG
jgi:hypothetical protein